MAKEPDYGDDMPLIAPRLDKHSDATGTGNKNVPMTGAICGHCGGINRHFAPCPRMN